MFCFAIAATMIIDYFAFDIFFFSPFDAFS